MEAPRISRRARAAFKVLEAIENPSDKALRVIEKASDQAISDGAILYGIRQGWVTLEVVLPEENRPTPQPSPETPAEPYVSPSQRWRQQRREEEIRRAQEVAERQRQRMDWAPPPEPTPAEYERLRYFKRERSGFEDVWEANPTLTIWDDGQDEPN